MEITKDALLRIVKTARLAMNAAETMQKLMVNSGGWTWADEISGQLVDSLFILSGEHLAAGKDFNNDSMTMRLLTSDMTDNAVADWFIMINKIRRKFTDEDVKQPKPKIVSKEEEQRMYVQSGGYKYTPEGEWT